MVVFAVGISGHLEDWGPGGGALFFFLTTRFIKIVE